MSLHPIVRTTASSGIAAASASAVESSSISSASSHASWNGSCDVSRWAHNHHSGPHSGCRSTTRRQATTSPDGSNRIELIACAVSRTSDAGSAPRARATYRRCSIGCTLRHDTAVLGRIVRRSLPSLRVATNPPPDLVLAPLGAASRPLEDWLTTFHLASVVLDPYTNESSWILKTAARILEGAARLGRQGQPRRDVRRG